MSTATAPRQKTVGAAAALALACKAWATLKHAEAEIVRLGQYKKLSPSMRDDLQRHIRRAAEAREALDGLLKVAA